MFKNLEQNIFLRKLYFNQSEVSRSLMLSCAFSLSILAARIMYTGEAMFLFLAWNLFLAYLPYSLSTWMEKRPFLANRPLFFWSALAAWLLIVPNSFYIITDLFHLRKAESMPLWFDLALIFSFTWNALLMGMLSVRQMERLVEEKWKGATVFFSTPVMFLIALGIYIGRYLRYNSWDVLTNPFQLLQDLLDLVLHPVHYRFDWSMVLCYGLLLTFAYITLKRLSSVLAK
jgi:uncharacterized membrane protein